jgi:hypothetical protein
MAGVDAVSALPGLFGVPFGNSSLPIRSGPCYKAVSEPVSLRFLHAAIAARSVKDDSKGPQ